MPQSSQPRSSTEPCTKSCNFCSKVAKTTSSNDRRKKRAYSPVFNKYQIIQCPYLILKQQIYRIKKPQNWGSFY
ncbi:hypothetical protein A6J76_005090 [Aggregatibacter aphrophilus]|nr:hypothetical protein A6J76_005090 [Aggregatibacter aphrophilus]